MIKLDVDLIQIGKADPPLSSTLVLDSTTLILPVNSSWLILLPYDEREERLILLP